MVTCVRYRGVILSSGPTGTDVCLFLIVFFFVLLIAVLCHAVPHAMPCREGGKEGPTARLLVVRRKRVRPLGDFLFVLYRTLLLLLLLLLLFYYSTVMFVL